MPTSPSTFNYSVLKGICYFTPTGGVEQDLGNAPEVELTPAIEKLDHFSSRTGVRSKDRSIVLEKTLTLRIVLDEITEENLRKALLGGALSTNSDGNSEFAIFAESEIAGSFRFDGQNTVGNLIRMTLPNVSFTPTGSLKLISDEWAQIEITAEVLIDDETEDFGTVEVEAQA